MADSTAQKYALPYSAVPSEKRNAIVAPTRDALLQRDFSGSAIRPDYIFTSEGSGLKLHLAAFTDPERWDPITSGVNFYYNPHDLEHTPILQQLSKTGAPFNLIGDAESVSLYVVSQDRGLRVLRILSDVAYEKLPQALTQYGADISPQRIKRAKHGLDTFVLFPQFSGLQLRLFAIEVTREILVNQFAAALKELASALVNDGLEGDAPALAVELLAAVVLAHKGVLGQRCSRQGAPLDVVVEAATRQFSRYFELTKADRYRRVADSAFAILQQVRYSSLTPDILEALYEEAYPEIEVRRREGRYNTPLYVTHRILGNIPVETLPPAQRIVADMTCGVGSFLVASYERLVDLTDMDKSGKPLREHLFGNDRDKFTADLARLSLLLTSQKDEWHIDHQDALQWEWLDRNSPGIIVGNPPFGGSRKEGSKATAIDEHTGSRTRWQKADAFVERAVHTVSPGGYLAMLVPQSFVGSQASSDTRRLLLEECDLLEIWELPNEVFSGATVRPMVLFAQRKTGRGSQKLSSTPVRVRTVQPRSLDQFRLHGAFTASGVAPNQGAWDAESKLGPGTTHVISYTLALPWGTWKEIEERSRRLDEVADVFAGPIVGTERPWEAYEPSKVVKWLPNARRCLARPFALRYGDHRIRYPNDLHWPRMSKERVLAGTKVLVASAPDPTWGQRVKVAIERRGYYPSDSFWVITPRPGAGPEITLEVLAAIASWYVGNAWIVDHLKAPKILKGPLRSLPFPRQLTMSDSERITLSVRELERCAQVDRDSPEARREIDRILTAAYELDTATVDRVRMVAQWDQVDPSTLKRTPPDPARLVLVTGGVEDVDAWRGTITLWMTGLAGVHNTVITDDMPGWMLRPGAEFWAHIPESNLRDGRLRDVRWVRVSSHPYGYLDQGEVLDRLSEALA